MSYAFLPLLSKTNKELSNTGSMENSVVYWLIGNHSIVNNIQMFVLSFTPNGKSFEGGIFCGCMLVDSHC